MILKRPLTFFFFHDTAPTEIYTLSLHDALPISNYGKLGNRKRIFRFVCFTLPNRRENSDRKSTRLNSSHQMSSYAVFCLKKKNSTGVACRFPTTESRLRDLISSSPAA